MTTHSRLDGIPRRRQRGQELKNPLVLAPAALSGCPRGTAFRFPAEWPGGAFRAPPAPREAGSRAMGARGGPECGMGADSGFRPSVPRLSVIPVCYGGTSCRACDWEADGAVGGRLQRPAAEGHRGRWRRVRARRPTRSPRARRRSDCRNRKRCGVSPIPAGFGGCHRNPREAATSPCRRPRTAGRGASPAARRVSFCRHCFLPPPLTLAAGLRGVPALPGPRLREPYSGACRVVPFYCR
jgi:hypothetical protein